MLPLAGLDKLECMAMPPLLSAELRGTTMPPPKLPPGVCVPLLRPDIRRITGLGGGVASRGSRDGPAPSVTLESSNGCTQGWEEGRGRC